MFNTSSEFELQLAFGLGAASMTVAVGLALQVLLMRLRGVRRASELQALHARWRPLLARAALGEAAELTLPALQRGQRADLLLLWNELQDGLRGSGHDGLNQLAARLDLHTDAARWAEGAPMAERVIGLATLGHLGQPEDWARLRAAMGDALSLVSVSAARALLQLDAERAAPEVLDEYLRRSDWPAPRLGTLLRDAGAQAVAPPLLARLKDASAADQVRLLPLLRFAESPHRGSVLHRIIERSDNPQVLSLALRQLHGPTSLPHVRAHARHADALVRSAAAQALGRIGMAHDRGLLTTLLSDSDWWVRYRAAQAQLTLPGTDAATLQALRAGLSDRFALDALDHASAEQVMLADAPALQVLQ